MSEKMAIRERERERALDEQEEKWGIIINRGRTWKREKSDIQRQRENINYTVSTFQKASYICRLHVAPQNIYQIKYKWDLSLIKLCGNDCTTYRAQSEREKLDRLM